MTKEIPMTNDECRMAPRRSTRRPSFFWHCGFVIILPVLAGLLSGCHSMGPTTIPQDRMNYSDAIAESWKDQVLRNLVKLRYMDTPIFLDVGQIVGGYTWQTSVSAGGRILSTAGDSRQQPDVWRAGGLH